MRKNKILKELEEKINAYHIRLPAFHYYYLLVVHPQKDLFIRYGEYESFVLIAGEIIRREAELVFHCRMKDGYLIYILFDHAKNGMGKNARIYIWAYTKKRMLKAMELINKLK